MYMTKYILIALMLVPSITFAQTNTQDRISVLQHEIVVLEAELISLETRPVASTTEAHSTQGALIPWPTTCNMTHSTREHPGCDPGNHGG